VFKFDALTPVMQQHVINILTQALQEAYEKGYQDGKAAVQSRGNELGTANAWSGFSQEGV